MNEGNLELDGPREPALVIEGDLAVAGSIVNAEDDGGRSLHVRGNLRARNMVLGGAEVTVDGDADIDGLLFYHGGENSLTVGGETRAGLILDEYGDRPGMPLSDYLHPDVAITRDDEEYPIPVERVDPEALIARVRAGLPVLREPGDPRPRKSYAQWLADCGKYGAALEYVPRELIDRAMALAAVRSYGHAIGYVPRELVTDELVDAALAESAYAIASVPEEFRTAERCRVAVEFLGRLLEEVPVALRTPELCALAIEHDSRVYEVFQLIPEEHVTPELCLRAAQRDGLSLSEMPERFRTFEVCVAAAEENMFALTDVPEEIRDEVRKAVYGEPVEVSPEVRAFLEGPRPSKLRLFLWVMFGGHGPAKPGLLGWFERRPAFSVILRGLVSVLMLIVHLWLTAQVWRVEGVWPAVATFLGLFLSELYWAWQWGASALTILGVIAVALYWIVEIPFRILGKRWRAAET